MQVISEPNELDLVLEAIQQTCGYDFRHYARPSLQRRLSDLADQSNCTHLADMVPHILHDGNFLDQVLRRLSITVTQMFRDPAFYEALRTDVLPVLRNLPVIKVWHAGCATGEEVYSLAILLKEEGLYDRARIYATDFNSQAVQVAQEGIYSMDAIKTGTANYISAGGRGSLSEYYHADYGATKINETLKSNITFSHHDLATDGPFSRMDLILCRNVMIYFDQSLQQRVFSLLADSLHPEGFLCLGTRETLRYSGVCGSFEEFAEDEKIYQRTARNRRMTRKQETIT
jgi:chemotaxis protein methyltransferase CheR